MSYTVPPAGYVSPSLTTLGGVGGGGQQQQQVLLSNTGLILGSPSPPTTSANAPPPVKTDPTGEEAVEKVQSSVALMQQVETTLQSLRAQNAELKYKFIEAKRDSFKKYFMVSEGFALSQCWRAWVAEWQVWRHDKNLESEHELRAREKERYEQMISQKDMEKAEMVAEISATNAMILQKELEKHGVEAQLREASNVIRSFGEVFGRCLESAQRYPESPRPTPAFVPGRGSTSEFVKEELHRILKEIDPRYLGKFMSPPPLFTSNAPSEMSFDRFQDLGLPQQQQPPILGGSSAPGGAAAAAVFNSLNGTPSVSNIQMEAPQMSPRPTMSPRGIRPPGVVAAPKITAPGMSSKLNNVSMGPVPPRVGSGVFRMVSAPTAASLRGPAPQTTLGATDWS